MAAMVGATLNGDTGTMEEILQFAHNIPEYAGERSGGAFHRTETPLLDYNNETELTAIVNLVYLAEGLYIKFGMDRDFSYIGMGLNYFDDAESERLPRTMIEYDWKEIKAFFSEFQDVFLKH